MSLELTAILPSPGEWRGLFYCINPGCVLEYHPFSGLFSPVLHQPCHTCKRTGIVERRAYRIEGNTPLRQARVEFHFDPARMAYRSEAIVTNEATNTGGTIFLRTPFVKTGGFATMLAERCLGTLVISGVPAAEAIVFDLDESTDEWANKCRRLTARIVSGGLGESPFPDPLESIWDRT